MNTPTETQTSQDMALTQQSEANQLQSTQPRKVPIPIGNSGLQLQHYDDLWRFSSCVARSGMAPKGIQQPEAIMVAIQMGLEVGLPPMTALQNIAVINGRPSIWGDAQLGVVRASGQLERYEESETNNSTDLIFRELCLTDDPAQKKALRLQLAKAQTSHVKSAEDFGVTVFVQRKGYEPIFNRFTVADARQAKLWAKEGPWTQYPARMLKFRARSFALRDQFGDALKGLLSAEEAGDLAPYTPNADGGPVKGIFGQADKPVQVITETASTPEPVVVQPEPPKPKKAKDKEVKDTSAPPVAASGKSEAAASVKEERTEQPPAQTAPAQGSPLVNDRTKFAQWMEERTFTWEQVKPVARAEFGQWVDNIGTLSDLNLQQAKALMGARADIENALIGGGQQS